ncbi:MAG: electron transfer flavoprotein subunit alpha/FixB family protein [Ilumatobacteraceae bacterium]
MGCVLVLVEHDRGTVAPATFEALTAARALGVPVHAIGLGAPADALAPELGAHGAEVVHQVHHDLLADYGPETWGAALAAAVRTLAPSAVLAAGTDRGNEVLAQVAARLDAPFVANCIELRGSATADRLEMTRVRWGGSLLEEASLVADVKILSVAPHAVEAVPAEGPGTPATLVVEIDPALARSNLRARVEREAGVTLSTAPVVVGGGRGVGSADGFAPLQELAHELGGVVGCSRAVTNNGWRNHTDQVGQTGTRIAPDVYFACGISGAIQHWVGAMASKHIIAVNTDPQANMVTRAGYAVIGDLHQVVPAITAEIRRRRAS